MSDIRVIALNGPPGSGKDTVADWLFDQSYNINHDFQFVHLKFSGPLKAAWYGLTSEPITDITKDLPSHTFPNYTQREGLILLSEVFVKPTFGKDAFGRLMLSQIEEFINSQYRNDIFVISDLGFEEELQPLIDHFGKEAILIIQLVREGCSFEGDSRSYINPPDVPPATLKNNSSKEDLFTEVRNVLHFQEINLPA